MVMVLFFFFFFLGVAVEVVVVGLVVLVRTSILYFEVEGSRPYLSVPSCYVFPWWGYTESVFSQCRRVFTALNLKEGLLFGNELGLHTR